MQATLNAACSAVRPSWPTVVGWLGALVVVMGLAQPVQAQVKSLASLKVINGQLAGRVVDYTHNHGQDRRIFSPILGMPRDLYVYLPPGYSPDKAYPLIVYLHLANIDEHIFIGSNYILQLDRMIQRGEFPPVVVACPDGAISGENRVREAHSFYVNGCQGRFQDHLVQEILPFLMRCYSIRPERGAHAVFGLSAGGFGALGLAIKDRAFFGAVVTMAGPANMRYTTCNQDNLADFDPATYRWNDRYDPKQVVGRFYCDLKPVYAEKYVTPVFGTGPGVHESIRRENPADLIFTTDLQPGQLDIYMNYPGDDNYNFDAQAQSFAWLAAQKGVAVTLECAPHGHHNLPYFRANHASAYRWLGRHLLPPVSIARAGG
ncbi:alpha/beta hydrolase [Singulisphaera acidiphila]|uniref:Enterochelin esterase-like enzyme n=1 Tax=Singulisphaera acidiphila (strain ATCC BAA-1392 / DSM 18658 / VKM B-2454 / MOB10) TaxID=886293 RepID=L0D831_SINAD|nr:alpha/beta hydrolase-fold protein [Singulisphaera acidiphila]AGA25372.1 enterochelin esterase-like enzyme [Singulisphaera acidiphila DSM 18658]